VGLSWFVTILRHPDRRHMAVELAESGRAVARSKIFNNRGKDCADVQELKRAPVSTDTTEPGIGSLDYQLHKTLASFHARFGLVAAQQMQIFSSAAGNLDRANKKRKRGEKLKEATMWNLTSHWDMPHAQRGHVLKSVGGPPAL
jgi:hypothetical protein